LRPIERRFRSIYQGEADVGRLDGKIACITGAAHGLGAATARLLAAEGAIVIATDIVDDRGAALASELGGPHRYARLDVSSEGDWRRVAGEIGAAHGWLDILINNAGVAHRVPVAEMTLADYERVIAVNQTGVFIGMRECIPLLRKAATGASIINVGSVAAVAATTLGQAAYAASKWAVVGMSRVAAAELGPFDIRVNVIQPAHIVEGTMSDPAMLQMFAQRSPLRRVGRSSEVANLALFLASDESSYCTGSEFTADGGSCVAMYEPDKGWGG
jgi:3alpha(or 20beta)-hydroxysteroid dehydrogenase